MRTFVLFSCLMALPVMVQAADAAKGKQLTATCQSCHGAGGISTSPLYPNLAGQKAPYLVKQLRDFQQGKRQDPVMSAMVKSLSEDDINNIAEYYSGLTGK